MQKYIYKADGFKSKEFESYEEAINNAELSGVEFSIEPVREKFLVSPIKTVDKIVKPKRYRNKGDEESYLTF